MGEQIWHDTTMNTNTQRAGDESLLACIGPSPYSEDLVRLSHQIASRRRIPWHAIYVDIRKPEALTAQAQNRVWGVIQLAESLGATTHILTGPSPADVILNYARENAITQIVIGNSQQPVWRRMLGLTPVDHLLRHTNNVDFLIINHGEEVEPVSSPARRSRSTQSTQIAWKKYVAAIGLVAVATLIGLPARGLIVPSDFITTYLLALVIAAVYLGFRMAALTALGSVLAFDFSISPIL